MEGRRLYVGTNKGRYVCSMFPTFVIRRLFSLLRKITGIGRTETEALQNDDKKTIALQ